MTARHTAASLVLLANLFPLAAQAQAPAPAGAGNSAAKSGQQEQIYGSQLMTPQERTAYHQQMRSASSADERERIRQQHHDAMQARAKERGVSLPDMPPAGRGGPGAGGGGMGYGPGSGPRGTAPGPGGPGK